MSWLTSLAGSIAGDIGSGLINSAFARSNAKKQVELQKELFDYQMSNAHQLEVEDLRKAGLNPILSASGSTHASIPSVSVDGSPASNLNATMLQRKQLKIADKQADIDLMNANTAYQRMLSDKALNAVKAQTERFNWKILLNQSDNIKANTDVLKTQVLELFNRINNNNKVTDATVNQLNALAYNLARTIDINQQLANAETEYKRSGTDYNRKLIASLSKESDVLMDQFRKEYYSSPLGEVAVKFGIGLETMFPILRYRPSVPGPGGK